MKEMHKRTKVSLKGGVISVVPRFWKKLWEKREKSIRQKIHNKFEPQVRSKNKNGRFFDKREVWIPRRKTTQEDT